MKLNILIIVCIVITAVAMSASAHQWDRVSIPSDAGEGRKWRLDEELSDDFEYDFETTPTKVTFGGKWTNYYMDPWPGPGTTLWRHENVSVKQGHLRIHASRIEGEDKTFEADSRQYTLPATRLGCISSQKTVQPPAFVEARVKIANAVLASNVWMLSPDHTQEIDILEAYGGPGADNRNAWFSKRIHLSHHVFIRRPLQDYQPEDGSTWYFKKSKRAKRGHGVWAGGYHRAGVHWRSPTHLDYYLDGKLVKTTSGLDDQGEKGGIDPRGYTKDETGKRTGLVKPMHIIINMEAQSWNAAAGRTPTDQELKKRGSHTFLVDWIRTYKPQEAD